MKTNLFQVSSLLSTMQQVSSTRSKKHAEKAATKNGWKETYSKLKLRDFISPPWRWNRDWGLEVDLAPQEGGLLTAGPAQSRPPSTPPQVHRKISALALKKPCHKNFLMTQLLGLTQNTKSPVRGVALGKGCSAEAHWQQQHSCPHHPAQPTGAFQLAPSSSMLWPNWIYFTLLFKQESCRKRGSCSAISSEQDFPLPSLDWRWICFRPKRMSETYEPQASGADL